MCIIAMAKKRKLTKEEFDNCFRSNKDGVGFGYSVGKKTHYEKGFMTLESAWEAYEKVDVFPHIVHFRIGTSGGKTDLMTHPFTISDDSPLTLKYDGMEGCLFHNGVVYNWQDKLLSHILKTKRVPEGSVGDTRAVAIIAAEKLKLVDDFNGKFVSIRNGKIRYKGDFVEENGIWFSNDGYKTRVYTKSTANDSLWWDDWDKRYGASGSFYGKYSENTVPVIDTSKATHAVYKKKVYEIYKDVTPKIGHTNLVLDASTYLPVYDGDIDDLVYESDSIEEPIELYHERNVWYADYKTKNYYVCWNESSMTEEVQYIAIAIKDAVLVDEIDSLVSKQSVREVHNEPQF